MTALLEQLAEAESPSLEPATQAGPFAILADELKSIGFEVERVPGRETGDHLEARPRGRPGAYQLLLGHMDTVWPAERSSRCRVAMTTACAVPVSTT